MNRHAALHELIALDRSLVRLFERRARLLAAVDLSHDERQRLHQDLASRTSGAHARGELEALFERIDELTLAGGPS